MTNNHKILIITDDTGTMRKMAQDIAGVFGKPPLENYRVSAVDAEKFSATDLLPAAAFFIGCNEPDAFSYLYIEELFNHINLAGRPCSVFSANAQAIKYLSKLLHASEAAVYKPLQVTDGKTDEKVLTNWILNTLKKGE